MTTRIAVIGLGSIAVEHLKAYQANVRSELVAVCDVDLERAKARGEQFGVPRVTGDFEEILSDPDVDAVSVCVPNTLHAPIAEAALRAGKNVLVEKPMTVTVPEAEALVKAVEETGQALQVGYVRRYAPNALVTKRFLDAGEFGDIYAARATLLRTAVR
jgi:predicted dehydrogenase